MCMHVKMNVAHISNNSQIISNDLWAQRIVGWQSYQRLNYLVHLIRFAQISADSADIETYRRRAAGLHQAARILLTEIPLTIIRCRLLFFFIMHKIHLIAATTTTTYNIKPQKKIKFYILFCIHPFFTDMKSNENKAHCEMRTSKEYAILCLVMHLIRLKTMPNTHKHTINKCSNRSK